MTVSKGWRAHIANETMLQVFFDARLISLYLTADFYIWRYLKDVLFQDNPRHIEDSRERINENQILNISE